MAPSGRQSEMGGLISVDCDGSTEVMMDRFADGDSGLGRVTSHLVSVKVTRAGIGGAKGSRGGATATELLGPRTRTNQGRRS